jgi:hypothetical protein
VTGGWRDLHVEDLSELYSSPSIIRVIVSEEDGMGIACSTNVGDRISAIDGKAGRIGRPSRSWVDNIRMDLGEAEWGFMAGLIWLRIGTRGGLLRTR